MTRKLSEADKAYRRKYYQDHREAQIISALKRYEQCKKDPKFLEYSRTKAKKYYRALRVEVITHYGGKCVCCGETTLQFLVLDHKNGGGSAHRRSIGGGSKTYNWAKKQGYPKILQILCANCNTAKGMYGKCPHKILAKGINK